jgi:hypothetical protein
MIKDLNYWQNLSPPMCPNSYEIELYHHHVKGCGPVCLLGMTKQLQHLCEYMIDLHPIKQDRPVLRKNWNEIDTYSEAFIGDGVLNLEGLQLVDKLLKNCEKLVFRVFLKKFSWMKYEKHFPDKFPNAKFVIPTQEDIAIVVWENAR